MKRLLILIVVLVVIALAWWLGSPLFIDKKVSEEFPISTSPEGSMQVKTGIETSTQIVKSGTFTGFDSIHYGSGTVNLIKAGEEYIVRFEDDFNVANGPDLYVGFGKNGEYKKGSEIARLKGNIGSQNYVLPAEINLDDHNEVWIWCKAFSVPFAKAILSQS